jgi:hypothetical protein
MDLHPYGPVEAAMEESAVKRTNLPKSNYKIWLGIFVALLGGGIVYLTISKNKKKSPLNTDRKL